jgi:uncharacterized RDD family membrane protein YckC
VGKAVMGIRVVGINGRRLPPARALVRTVAYLVSLVPLFAGFLWVLVDRERRGWHDHIARSRVVYEPDESVWPGTRSPARHPPVIGNSEVEENV